MSCKGFPNQMSDPITYAVEGFTIVVGRVPFIHVLFHNRVLRFSLSLNNFSWDVFLYS